MKNYRNTLARRNYATSGRQRIGAWLPFQKKYFNLPTADQSQANLPWHFSLTSDGMVSVLESESRWEKPQIYIVV